MLVLRTRRPEGLVEVRTKQPVRYTLEPVVVEGQLAVLTDDPTAFTTAWWTARTCSDSGARRPAASLARA